MRFSIVDILNKYKDSTVLHVMDCLTDGSLKGFFKLKGQEHEVDKAVFSNLESSKSTYRIFIKFLNNPDYLLNSAHSLPLIEIENESRSILSIYFKKDEIEKSFEPTIFPSRYFVRALNSSYGTVSILNPATMEWITETYKKDYAALIKVLVESYDQDINATLYLNDVLVDLGIKNEENAATTQHKDLFKSKLILKYMFSSNRYLKLVRP